MRRHRGVIGDQAVYLGGGLALVLVSLVDAVGTLVAARGLPGRWRPTRFDLTVTVTGAFAEVLAECARGSGPLSGSSTVGSVTVDGIPYVPGGETTQLPLPTVGTLYLNYEQRSDTDAQGGNDTIVRRAVFLDSVNAAVPDIVVGEAKASVRGC